VRATQSIVVPYWYSEYRYLSIIGNESSQLEKIPEKYRTYHVRQRYSTICCSSRTVLVGIYQVLHFLRSIGHTTYGKKGTDTSTICCASRTQEYSLGIYQVLHLLPGTRSTWKEPISWAARFTREGFVTTTLSWGINNLTRLVGNCHCSPKSEDYL
jgi:hypothetical protein